MLRFVRIFLVIVLIISVIYNAPAQDSEILKIGFYNVENLFDPEDDPSTADDEFTPSGFKNWTNYRLFDKTIKIYKVFTGIGEWVPPAVMGLCEVENSGVLSKLINETPLKYFNYDFIHFESPDRRGIDVAMLYRTGYLNVLFAQNIGIYNYYDTSFRTRDILYVKGILGGADTVHFFINHWPSRYGNYQESVKKRLFVAGVLKKYIDSLNRQDLPPNIVIMGDFNDTPSDESILRLLSSGGKSPGNGHGLVNLINHKAESGARGTIKYRHMWQVFDLIIVTEKMLDKKSKIYINKKNARIYWNNFLLEDDERYLGEKPFRTYIGPKYNGGYSDHLPVFMEVEIR